MRIAPSPSSSLLPKAAATAAPGCSIPSVRCASRWSCYWWTTEARIRPAPFATSWPADPQIRALAPCKRRRGCGPAAPGWTLLPATGCFFDADDELLPSLGRAGRAVDTPQKTDLLLFHLCRAAAATPPRYWHRALRICPHWALRFGAAAVYATALLATPKLFPPDGP